MFKSRNSEPARIDHRIAGDTARDDKNWRAAITAYQAHLNDVPDDAGISVQLGNCAKEAGEFEMSETAYQQALAIAPNTADTHLQLGHLYKVMRRWPLALSHYRRALELDPLQIDAGHEINSVQRMIEDLPFQLPVTFLDHRAVYSLPDLFDLVENGRRSEDPFVKFNDLIIQ